LEAVLAAKAKTGCLWALFPGLWKRGVEEVKQAQAEPEKAIMSPRWRQHEERSRSTRAFKGYKIEKQKTSTSAGKRPDFFGISKRNPRKRIVGDAKYVKELTPKHVQQVRGYKGYPFFAQKGVIIVKKSTRVPDEVRNLAKQSNIRIVRKRARRKNKSFWESLFG
jgi:hypothetical protein